MASSLTASFKRARVLKKNEHGRVSCTRIRCGIATYACNEGGMEMSFFAKHFMKNREETTGLHYNLLSNRRHALNIAMQLYKTFSGETLQSSHQDELANQIKKSTQSIKSVKSVIDWLSKSDGDIEKTEINEFEAMLKELFEKNTASFYSKVNNSRYFAPIVHLGFSKLFYFV